MDLVIFSFWIALILLTPFALLITALWLWMDQRRPILAGLVLFLAVWLVCWYAVKANPPDLPAESESQTNTAGGLE